MRISGLIQESIVDGPGLRFTVFTQGCPHACEGCHNPATHAMDGGDEKSIADIIAEMLSDPLTDGVTLSGGEPFVQAVDCAAIAKAAHDKGLNVWAYSGWTFEELVDKSKTDSGVAALINELDVLVDGRFVLPLRTLSLKWRGSTNQRLVDVKKSLEAGVAVLLV